MGKQPGVLTYHLHVSKNILIALLIVVTWQLDVLDAYKNVLQPMELANN